MPTAFGRPGPRLRKLPGVLGAGASRNSRRVRFMAYVGFGGPTTPLVVYRSDMTSLRSGKQASCAAPQATEWPSRSADCRLKAPLCGPPASARFMGSYRVAIDAPMVVRSRGRPATTYTSHTAVRSAVGGTLRREICEISGLGSGSHPMRARGRDGIFPTTWMSPAPSSPVVRGAAFISPCLGKSPE